jgi:hypothetical protein
MEAGLFLGKLSFVEHFIDGEEPKGDSVGFIFSDGVRYPSSLAIPTSRMRLSSVRGRLRQPAIE